MIAPAPTAPFTGRLRCQPTLLQTGSVPARPVVNRDSLMTQPANQPAHPIASTPDEPLEAVIFDLGMVLVEIDFRRSFATWAGYAGVDPRTGRKRGLKTAIATVRQWRQEKRVAKAAA